MWKAVIGGVANLMAYSGVMQEYLAGIVVRAGEFTHSATLA